MNTAPSSFKDKFRWVLVLLALPALSACSQGFRSLAGPGGAFELRSSWGTIAADLVLILFPLLPAVFFRQAVQRLLGDEEPDAFSLPRIFLFTLAFLLAVLRFYPHTAWEIRVDDTGIIHTTWEKTVAISWNETVKVRNNLQRERNTYEGLKPDPRLEIVDIKNQTLYFEEKELGPEAYRALLEEVGNRYYGREKLTDGKIEIPPEPAQPPSAKSTESK
ncbi:MAG: hypothetical protein AB1405_04005 [Bdellovibrionota bacterium]